ncbi:MAG: hypothetical protein ACLFVJ_06630 [Persicimonas sp.]
MFNIRLHPEKSRRPHSSRGWLALLTFSMLLFAVGCGAEDDGLDDPPAVNFEDVPTPDPGPRQFPKPDGRFFEHDDIIAVNPDPDERKEMLLTDNFYWLSDQAADSLLEYSLDRLVFPLEGNRELLGYKPGHIVGNKFAVIRHYIEEVRVVDNRIIWETRPAEIGEIVEHGNFYIHIKPGAEVPIGFDPLDVYLYDNPQEQLDDIRNNLDSRLVRQFVDRMRTNDQYRPGSLGLGGTNSGAGGGGTQPLDGELATRRQPLSCSFPDVGGSDLYNCDDYVRSNEHDYRPRGSNHSQCVSEGNWKYEQPCRDNIEDAPFDYIPDPDADQPHQEPHRGCRQSGNTKAVTNTKDDIENNPYQYMPDPNAAKPHEGCRMAGNTKTSTNNSGDTIYICVCDGLSTSECVDQQEGETVDICVCDGLSTSECVEQQCDKLCWCDTGNLDQCSKKVCKDTCGFKRETQEQDSGGSDSADGMGGSLSFCMNTDTNPEDDGRCPGDMSVELNDSDPGTDLSYQLGPDTLNLKLKPIFMATVGVKASFDFNVKCCVKVKAVAKIGVYAGVGYGLNASINVLNAGASSNDSLTKYYSDITGSPLATIQIWILQVQVDPYLRMQFRGEAGIGGSLAYEYYDEDWFYACVWFGTKNGSQFQVADEDDGSTVTKCNLPNHSRDAQFNGFIEQGFNSEVGAGIALALGIELNLYGRHRTGVWFEPIRVLADVSASLRAPRCNWDYAIRFGWLFGIGVDLGIINLSKEWSRIWSFLPTIADEGALTGGLWESLFGCGVYDTADPYSGESIECSPGDEGDQKCVEDLDGPAKCFVRECVEDGPLRVSLGWFTPGADLNLHVRTPSGEQHSAAISYPGTFTRHDCAGVCGEESPSARLIENAVFSSAETGEYQIWVEMHPDSTVDQPVQYTIEVDSDETRQDFSGTIYPDRSDSSPTVFTLPVGQ